MPIRPSLTILAGAVLTGVSAFLLAEPVARDFIPRMETQAAEAIEAAGGTGVTARFASASGTPSRHPVLRGGEALDTATRTRVAHAVDKVPGVGGVIWSDGTARAESGEPTYQPLHCQEDVEGLLQTRSIRFEEALSLIHI